MLQVTHNLEANQVGKKNDTYQNLMKYSETDGYLGNHSSRFLYLNLKPIQGTFIQTLAIFL